MIYCGELLKWCLSQGDLFIPLLDHNEWSKTVGWPCQVNTQYSLYTLLHVGGSIKFQCLKEWESKQSCCEGKWFSFYCCCLQAFCFLLSLLAEKHVVQCKPTQGYLRTTPISNLIVDWKLSLNWTRGNERFFIDWYMLLMLCACICHHIQEKDSKLVQITIYVPEKHWSDG